MVSTPLKNISQIGSFPQVGVKIKNIWNHHPVYIHIWWSIIHPVESTRLRCLKNHLIFLQVAQPIQSWQIHCYSHWWANLHPVFSITIWHSCTTIYSIICSYYDILRVLSVYNQKRVRCFPDQQYECSANAAFQLGGYEKPKNLIAPAHFLRFLLASQGNIMPREKNVTHYSIPAERKDLGKPPKTNHQWLSDNGSGTRQPSSVTDAKLIGSANRGIFASSSP